MQAESIVNIVLIEPQIPQNTGSIARMCAANHWQLTLVKPLGFSLEDKYLKRSGLDYWPFVKLEILENLAALEALLPQQRYHILSTKGSQNYTSRSYQPGDWLLFGSEPSGFPPGFLDRHPQQLATIPMQSPDVRSLNLATATGIVAYEALRQIQISGDL